jgi:hypothetical protein
MSAAHIYLSKDGKSFGPYTPEQIDQMRASGDILQYTWICSDPAQGWQPVNAPPPPPPPVPEADEPPDAPADLLPDAVDEPHLGSDLVADFASEDDEIDAEVEVAAPTAPKPTRTRKIPTSAPALAPAGSTRVGIRSDSPGLQIKAVRLLAICHNAKHFVSGTLVQATVEGGTLANPSPSEPLPIFHRGTRVSVNLLDDSTGRSENVRARVTGAAKKNGIWEYELSWEMTPQLLQNSPNLGE